MSETKYIYSFNYHHTESALCKLESLYLFNKEEDNKLLFSDIHIDPSTSAFIKKRLDISLFSDDYSELITQIKNKKICIERFKVEYLALDGNPVEYDERLQKLRDIGLSIEGEPDYYDPVINYALTFYNGIWYFGELIKNNFDWHKHKQKPYSFSNSISIVIGKALINIASKGSQEKKLLDACCGVGTILLEGCFSKFNIEGCDINEKTCTYARENLNHFNYTTTIHYSDIKDISEKFDAAIIDLPYNLFTKVSDNTDAHIIESTSKIADRIVIVSTTDITDLINTAGFNVINYCSVSKRGKKTFARKIWLCEKMS